MIIYSLNHFRQDTFIEFFLIRTATGFKCPHTLPENFEVVQEQEFENTRAVQVKRVMWSQLEFITYQSLHNAWILASDCYERGAFEPEHLPGRRVFFGIPIETASALLIIQFEKSMRVVKPISVYHGTSMEKETEVAKGIQETYGMLGYGAYFGTFWKAARFACLGQDYIRRPGTVFRAIAFAFRLREYPMETWACDCDRCKKVDWGKAYADHGNHWSTLGFDGAHASASCESSGICRDGKSKYVLRNEEWVFSPHKIMLTHVARVDQRRVPPDYDPMYRDVVIY
jgi:hypothetical protein